MLSAATPTRLRALFACVALALGANACVPDPVTPDGASADTSAIDAHVPDAPTGEIRITARYLDAEYGRGSYFLALSPVWLPTDVHAVRIERACGGSPDFEDTGVTLSTEDPIAFIDPPFGPDIPAPPPEQERFVTESLATLHTSVAELEAILAETPLETCIETPSCNTRYRAARARVDEAANQVRDGIPRLRTAVHVRPTPGQPSECIFQGIPLFEAAPMDAGSDGNGGDATSDVATDTRVMPRPIRVGLSIATAITPRAWNADRVDAPPCNGTTPAECYRIRVRELLDRLCRDGARSTNLGRLCDAWRNGWVHFPPPPCDLPGANGETVDAPQNTSPDAGIRSPEAGTTAPPTGVYSAVTFDWAYILTDECAYGTVVHELTHVLDKATDPLAARRDSLIEFIAQRVVAAHAELMRALAANDAAAVRRATMELDELGRTAQTVVLSYLLNFRARTECHAYLTTLQAANFTTEGLTDAEAVMWFKFQLRTRSLQSTIDLYGQTGIPVDAETQASVCACLRDIRSFAIARLGPGTGHSLWYCASRDGNPTARQEWENANRFFMCGG